MNGQSRSSFPWLLSWDPRMIDRHWPSHRQKIQQSLQNYKSLVTMETWKLKGSVTHAVASTLQEEKEFCTIDIWSEFLTEVNVTEESSIVWKARAKNLVCKWNLSSKNLTMWYCPGLPTDVGVVPAGEPYLSGMLRLSLNTIEHPLARISL